MSTLKLKRYIIEILVTIFVFMTEILYAQEKVTSINQHGYLKINLPTQSFSLLDSFYVVIDEKYEDFEKLSKFDSLLIPIGLRSVTIITEHYEDARFKVKITEGKTTVKSISLARSNDPIYILINSSYLWIKSGINVVIYTDDDSDVLIDNKLIGHGIVKMDLPSGQYEVITRHKLAGNSRRFITINSKKLKKLIMYNRPEKTKSQLFSLFPGASQVYKKENTKGSVIFGLTSVSLILAAYYQTSYINNNDLYKQYWFWYKISITEELENFYRGKAQNHYESAQNAVKMRNIFLYTALGIYVFNIIDALWKKPDGGYRPKTDIDPLKVIGVTIRDDLIGIYYCINL